MPKLLNYSQQWYFLGWDPIKSYFHNRNFFSMISYRCTILQCKYIVRFFSLSCFLINKAFSHIFQKKNSHLRTAHRVAYQLDDLYVAARKFLILIVVSLSFFWITSKSKFPLNHVTWRCDRKTIFQHSNSTCSRKSAGYWSTKTMSGNPVTLYLIAKVLPLSSRMITSYCPSYTLIIQENNQQQGS